MRTYSIEELNARASAARASERKMSLGERMGSLGAPKGREDPPKRRRGAKPGAAGPESGK
jgi:hypothetical protein